MIYYNLLRLEVLKCVKNLLSAFPEQLLPVTRSEGNLYAFCTRTHCISYPFVYPEVLSPKILNGFQWRFVFRVHAKLISGSEDEICNTETRPLHEEFASRASCKERAISNTVPYMRMERISR
jgi:hypothetical protein